MDDYWDFVYDYGKNKNIKGATRQRIEQLQHLSEYGTSYEQKRKAQQELWKIFPPREHQKTSSSERFKWSGEYLDTAGGVRPKKEYPYSYSSFVTWESVAGLKANGGAYSDRMRQWDYEKNEACIKAVWGNIGQYFDQRTPDDIERYCQLYFGKPELKLVKVIESCNQSSGYPLWYFATYQEDV